jgi:hypothetical protein
MNRSFNSPERKQDMGDCYFHASLATVYAAMAIEAWQLRHHRLACGYGVLAGLSLGFAGMHLPWPWGVRATLWT